MPLSLSPVCVVPKHIYGNLYVFVFIFWICLLSFHSWENAIYLFIYATLHLSIASEKCLKITENLSRFWYAVGFSILFFFFFLLLDSGMHKLCLHVSVSVSGNQFMYSLETELLLHLRCNDCLLSTSYLCLCSFFIG